MLLAFSRVTWVTEEPRRLLFLIRFREQELNRCNSTRSSISDDDENLGRILVKALKVTYHCVDKYEKYSLLGIYNRKLVQETPETLSGTVVWEFVIKQQHNLVSVGDIISIFSEYRYFSKYRSKYRIDIFLTIFCRYRYFLRISYRKYWCWARATASEEMCTSTSQQCQFFSPDRPILISTSCLKLKMATSPHSSSCPSRHPAPHQLNEQVIASACGIFIPTILKCESDVLYLNVLNLS